MSRHNPLALASVLAVVVAAVPLAAQALGSGLPSGTLPAQVAGGLAWSCRIEPSLQDGVRLDVNLIRHGKASDFNPSKGHKVATVRSTDVYKEIPAYQIIVKERVQEGSARWVQLMREATAAYHGALQRVAGTTYVLIVEEGGISGYPVTDVTDAVIQVAKSGG